MKFYRTARLTAGAGSRHMRGGFYRGTYYLKKYGNMCWTHGNIRIYIYEGVVEPFLQKKLTRADANCAGHGRKIRGEYASSTTYSEVSERADKRRKRYADHPNYRSKLPCLICVIRNSSYECKVSGDFSSEYILKTGLLRTVDRKPAKK